MISGQALSARLTVLFLGLVVLPSAALSLVSLGAIRAEHERLIEQEQRRIAQAAGRLAAAVGWRLRERDLTSARELGALAALAPEPQRLAPLLGVLRTAGYRDVWLVGSDGQPVGAQRPLAAWLEGRLAPWLAATPRAPGYVTGPPGAGGERPIAFVQPLDLPAGRYVAVLEHDTRRWLARELEALVTLLGDRERAHFAIRPALRRSGGRAAAGGAPTATAAIGAQGSEDAGPLVRERLPTPLEHLVVEVTAVAPPGEGALGVLVRRLHVWAIVFLLCGLLVGAIVTTVTVHREIRTAALKSDFVTTVTHELKTPLTSIGMFAQTLLLGRVQDEAERTECLEIIARETERLSRLIDRVLTFSKIEAQKKRFELRLTDLTALVKESMELFETQMRSAPDPVVFEYVELAELPPVLCDRAAIQEVLLNLFSNAYKYSRWRRSDPGASSAGDDPIVLSGDVRPRRIRVTVTKRRRWAMIAVRDWGVGISRGEQRKIFRKFYRANDVLTRDVEGSGIGLSLARSIMRAHRGDVTVRSRLGQGATFTLWLPR